MRFLQVVLIRILYPGLFEASYFHLSLSKPWNQKIWVPHDLKN